MLSCSALKLKYRNIQRQAGDIPFIFLLLHKQKLEERLESSANLFMPACLLESQIETLEIPTAIEVDTIVIDASQTVKQLLANILSDLGGETL